MAETQKIDLSPLAINRAVHEHDEDAIRQMLDEIEARYITAPCKNGAMLMLLALLQEQMGHHRPENLDCPVVMRLAQFLELDQFLALIGAKDKGLLSHDLPSDFHLELLYKLVTSERYDRDAAQAIRELKPAQYYAFIPYVKQHAARVNRGYYKDVLWIIHRFSTVSVETMLIGMVESLRQCAYEQVSYGLCENP